MNNRRRAYSVEPDRRQTTARLDQPAAMGNEPRFVLRRRPLCFVRTPTSPRASPGSPTPPVTDRQAAGARELRQLQVIRSCVRLERPDSFRLYRAPQ
jgi:hypothetical protein